MCRQTVSNPYSISTNKCQPQLAAVLVFSGGWLDYG